MSQGLLLAIVALVGLGCGIWFGLPGRYSQSADDIERQMDSGAQTPGRRRLAKRSINPLAWLRRSASTRSSPSRTRRSSRSSRGRGFNLESPDED